MVVDISVPRSWRYRVALAVLACLQNSLVGGLVYGWASIMPMLTAPIENRGAALSLEQTILIFSWASCVGMVSTLVLGWVLDRYGPRVCSVISNACVGIGCQLFAVSTEFETFAIATCLMSFGGPGIQVSIVHLANLFPENQFLTLSFLNGTISLSFAVLAGFDYLWETYPAITYQALFGYFSLLIAVSMVASALYWPDTPFEPPQKIPSLSEPTAEDEYIEASTAHQHLLEQPLESYLRIDPNHHELQRSMSYIVSKKAIESGNVDLVSLKDQPFRKQLFSGTYARALLCFIISCFLANFYVASISTELADFQQYSTAEQHDLVRTFTLIMSGGVVASFIVGWLMDRIGLESCTALTLMLGMLHMVVLGLYSDHRVWMIFGFCVYVIFRQFLFPVYIASLTARLGYKYFGILNGLGFAISGVAQAFMGSLVQVVQGTCHMRRTDDNSFSEDCDHGRWEQLHGIQFILLGSLILVPFFDHKEKTRQEKRIVERRVIRESWRDLTIGSNSAASVSNYGSLPTHEVSGLSNDAESSVGMEL